jgi:hypothetical protein
VGKEKVWFIIRVQARKLRRLAPGLPGRQALGSEGHEEREVKGRGFIRFLVKSKDFFGRKENSSRFRSLAFYLIPLLLFLMLWAPALSRERWKLLF